MEMTGSQIKQEAPETNPFKMAEINADYQWCLRSTTQGVLIWLPNFEEVFTPLGRLLESAEGQRNTTSYDPAEFFSRRFRENERALFTLTLRIEEAFPNEVEVISDLNELVFLMNELSRDFDRIFEDSERSTFTAPSSLNDCLSTVARNGLVGRPRLQILQQELQTLTMTPVFVGLISEELLNESIAYGKIGYGKI